MHPNALLELATELIHRVLQFRHSADGVVSDFFREHRALGSRERHPWPRRPTRCCANGSVLHHLAQSGRGEQERRLAVLAWQGNEGFLRAALSEAEREWLAQVSRVDRSALSPRLRHNLPDWLAERLEATLGDQFWPLVDASNRPRRSICESTHSRPSARTSRPNSRGGGSMRRRRLTRRSVCASKAAPRCRSSTRSPRPRPRCRTRAASCWP